MKFKDLLDDYLNKLNCSAKQLSVISGLSQTVISRYKSGERIPLQGSNQLNKLINALYKLSIDNNLNIKKIDLINQFNEAIKKNNFNYELFSEKLDELISLLNINIIEMSKYIVYDPSYISKIRSGERKPAHPEDFIEKICNFITTKYNSDNNIKTISMLLECKKDDLETNIYFEKLKEWLTNNNIESKNYIGDFLKNLDEFNLNNYIKSIKFDELKVPNIPFYKIKSKTYYGLEEMKKGELDFFKATVLSNSKGLIFMCSDMPMEDMAKDIEFGKKWMFAIAMSLKKGLHLNIIHNIDRPFNEMMLGLASWMPIYMTGQVSPYYLKDSKDQVYCHLNYLSDNVALTGECIKGYHNKGKYYLTNNKKEVNYYKEKTDYLLKKANPLMEIYTEKQEKNFNIFLNEYGKINSNRYRLLSNLPLFTINDELLISILKRNSINDNDIYKILEHKNNELNMINNILKNNLITDELNIDQEEKILSLENMLYPKKITYNQEEYTKHLELTKKFALNNQNYKFNFKNNCIFKNIRITSVENNFVVISKSANPIIHFVIKHQKLRIAIENFSAPTKELNNEKKNY